MTTDNPLTDPDFIDKIFDALGHMAPGEESATADPMLSLQKIASEQSAQTKAERKIYADVAATEVGKRLFAHLMQTVVAEASIPQIAQPNTQSFLMATVWRDAQRSLVLDMLQAARDFEEQEIQPEDQED